MNQNHLIYLYINKHILNCLVGNTSIKKKLEYTHDLDIQEENMVNLEELMLQKEDEIDEKVTDV